MWTDKLKGLPLEASIDCSGSKSHSEKSTCNLFDKFAAECDRPKFAGAEEALKNSKLAHIDSLDDISVTNYFIGKRKLKKMKKIQKGETAGPSWYNMKAPEVTDDVKTGLELMKLRSVITPKRFYKKDDRKGLPKHFQIGTIIPSKVPFGSENKYKKLSKKTLVDDLLNEAITNRVLKKNMYKVNKNKKKSKK